MSILNLKVASVSLRFATFHLTIHSRVWHVSLVPCRLD